jgi:glycosyltransferase involved in cell wall biosynthesis
MELWGLPYYDRRFSVDMTFSPTVYLPLNQRLPAIDTLVDFSWQRMPDILPLIQRLSLQLRFEQSLLRAAGVITISETMCRDLLRKYGSRLKVPVEPMPLGVQPDFFEAPYRSPRSHIRERYGLDGYIILSSGGTHPRKDIRTLARACGLLPASLTEQLYVVVIGPCESRARTAILSELDGPLRRRFIFTDFITFEETLDLFSLAQLFVFPTLDEGFGMPVLEAMAVGKPVICSELDVLREVGDEAVQYFPPRDASALASQIMQLWNNEEKRRQMTMAGLERARLFTWEASANRLLCLIRRVYAQKSSAKLC